jgi:uncharacterized protein (TIGR03437 family)
MRSGITIGTAFSAKLAFYGLLLTHSPLYGQASPSFTSTSVVNAASFRSSEGLAQGSIVTVFGANLGPAQSLSAGSYPLQRNLGGVTVRLAQAGNTFEALPIFVSAAQVNFILPSQTPVGAHDLTITFNGLISTGQRIQVVASAFGLFSFDRGTIRAVLQNNNSNGGVTVNLPETPAGSGQAVTLYGTGLGAISAPDDQAPPAGNLPRPDLEILVNGVPARRIYAGRSPCCSGLDQIVFEVPASAPSGCSVPVVIRLGGVYSNAGDMSTAKPGLDCAVSAFENLDLSACRQGSTGSLTLFRTSVDSGFGLPASDYPTGGGAFIRPVVFCPGLRFANQAATCSVQTRRSTDTPSNVTPLFSPLPVPGPTTALLDAGAQIIVTGPEGALNIDRTGTSTAPLYAVPTTAVGRNFLTGGTYTVRGTGGRDIGSFERSVDFQPTRLTSPVSGAVINRSGTAAVTWTGSSENDVTLVYGLSADPASQRYGVFNCVVPAGASSFTVPGWILSQLPDSPVGAGFIGVGNYTGLRSPLSFSATGLDYGLLIFGSATQVGARYSIDGR